MTGSTEKTTPLRFIRLDSTPSFEAREAIQDAVLPFGVAEAGRGVERESEPASRRCLTNKSVVVMLTIDKMSSCEG